jgi:hypothetical protein
VSFDLEAKLGVFKNGLYLFSRNTGKPGEKVIHPRAAFEILEERFYGYSSPPKDPRAAELARIALDG